jgi:DNA (cytosine-5)-methyltransferase 1
MKYLSVCSGVGSDHLAAPDHWQCVGFSEIEAFPSAVLKHHWPEVRNYGDFTTIGGDAVDAVDLLTGGTPCQAFSVAGQQRGLDDPRGELSLEFVRLARRTRARWIVWENVPGVLSSNQGRDFETFICALVDSGYSVAWRILDAQWFGVAQRRRRVWVVGYLGADVARVARVLFESDSSGGHPASRRQPRQEITGTLGGGSRTRDYPTDTEQITFWPDSVIALQMAQTGANGSGISADVAYTLDSASTQSQAVLVDGSWWDGGSIAGTLETTNQRMPDLGRFNAVMQTEIAAVDLAQITSSANQSRVGDRTIVRRLTPRECERLQGLPDDWTAIPFRGRPVAVDSVRYKAIGNGWAVPVARWIFARLEIEEKRQ